MTHILAVRNDRFGEFLLNIPAFRALKDSFPQARLTVVVSPYVQELAQCIREIDEVITWENKRHTTKEIIAFIRKLREEKYHICVILNATREFHLISFLAGIPVRVGYDRKCGFLLTHKIKDKRSLGDRHEVEYNLELVGLIQAKTQDERLSLDVEDGLAENLLKGRIEAGDILVCLHPSTSDPIKLWPEQNFQALAKRIIQIDKTKLLIIGGVQEVAKSRTFDALCSKVINLTGKTTLLELASVLKRCRLLISCDSGPMHLAASVGRSVIAIFRNDLPEKSARRWGPWGEGNVVIERPRLSDITVDDVFMKVKERIR